MKKFRNLPIILLLLATTLPPKLAADTIDKVSFEQEGGMPIPDEMLYFNLWSRPGKTFDEKKLDEDIKRLYETGFFTDVEAVTSHKDENKIDILFKLKNTPRVHKIHVKGHEKLDEDDIREAITLQEQAPLDNKQLRKSASNIRSLYHQDGYYEAKVVPKVEKAPDGGLTVTFDIQENLRLKVDDISFEGNTVFSSWRLKGAIQTHHSYLSWLLDWGLLNRDELEQDEIRLRNLYWTEGYLDFAVETKVEKDPEDPEYVDVTFKIFEGQPYKVSEINISGNEQFPTEELKSMLKLKPGETYNLDVEKQDINTLRDRYYPEGYCDFQCKPKLDMDYETHQVAVNYNIHENGKFTVHNLNISGNRVTKDYVIRRELPIHPGDPVDKIAMDIGKDRLMAMNYFDNVETFTTAAEEVGKKDVNYVVEEKPTAHVSVGAGWSSSDSLVGRIQLTETNFDITDPDNFFRGGGQRLSLTGQLGLVDNEVVLSFVEPWLFNIPLRLETAGFFHWRQYEYWRERHAGFDLELTKPFLGDFNTVSLGYLLDFVRVDDMDKNGYSKAFRDEQEGDKRRGAIRLRLARDTRNSLLNPTSGYLLSALGEINTVGLGATSNYYRLEAKGSAYWPFFDDLIVLHTGLKIGTMGEFASGKNVPLYERYFLGGQDTIRGFGYRKVSPLNADNKPLGGQSMIIGTVEVTHPIYKWVRGAAFCDVGNAWADPWDFDVDLNVGVGYGLRIMLPYINNTPIRLDLGVPVYRANQEYANRPFFYFNVGFDW